MEIILAIILGFLFGFVLQKIGASNPQMILSMLRLQDLHLMKVIVLGIGLSSLTLFIMLTFGLLDVGHMSVKSAYIGVAIGGGILAIGWVLSGFCPGMGIVAAGAGRKDAWFFIFGGLVGALIYMLSYGSIQDLFLFDSLGGKMTLVATGSEKYPSFLSGDVPDFFIAGTIAIIFIVISFLLPKKQDRKN